MRQPDPNPKLTLILMKNPLCCTRHLRYILYELDVDISCAAFSCGRSPQQGSSSVTPTRLLAVSDTQHMTPLFAGFLTLLALSSFVAYFQNIGNFLVTKYTSPLTLQVSTTSKPWSYM